MAILDERAQRELYRRLFKECQDAGAAGLSHLHVEIYQLLNLWDYMGDARNGEEFSLPYRIVYDKFGSRMK
ncbi:MAG: hypothetical protein V2A74_14505 [bacterium]